MKWRIVDNRIHLLFAFSLILPFFCGCEDDVFDKLNAEYRPPSLKVKAPEKLTVVKQPISFIYSPLNKRDPFRPLWVNKIEKDVEKPKAVETVKVVQKPKTELERYELDQLTVVAIITGVANPIAMVEGPGEKGYTLRRGSLIGRNGGRVTRIYSSGVVISEVYRDVTGKRIVNRVTMELQRKNNSNSPMGQILIGNQKYNITNNRLKLSPKSKVGSKE